MITQLKIKNLNTTLDAIFYMKIADENGFRIGPEQTAIIYEKDYLNDSELTDKNNIKLNENLFRRHYRAFIQLENHTTPEYNKISSKPNEVSNKLYYFQQKAIDDGYTEGTDAYSNYVVQLLNDWKNETFRDCFSDLEFIYKYDSNSDVICSYSNWVNKAHETTSYLMRGI